MEKDYNELWKSLRKKVKDKGLLEKTPGRGTVEMLFLSFSLLTLLMFIKSINIYIGAFILTAIMVRSTFVAHDLIHNQYFDKDTDMRLAHIFGNFILGFSAKWWAHAHNYLHHQFTNIAHMDEDIQAVGGTFIGKNSWGKYFHERQHVFYWLLLPLIYQSFWWQSVKFSFKEKDFNGLLILLLNLSIPLYIFLSLGICSGVTFLFFTYLIYGYWASLVFITNHVGCEVIHGEDAKNIPHLDLQTRTSRNVKGSYIIHWIYGGLNTQIEHHLFPKASRFNLLKISQITKEFCKENSIEFNEKGVIESYKEIQKELLEKGQGYYVKNCI